VLLAQRYQQSAIWGWRKSLRTEHIDAASSSSSGSPVGCWYLCSAASYVPTRSATRSKAKQETLPYPPINEQRQEVLFLISTPCVDRQGDVVIPEGCLETLDWYVANPVVLYAHDHAVPPIAHSYTHSGEPGVWITEEGVWSYARFHGKTQLSEEIFRLCAEGILRGASIGFYPRRYEEIPPREDLDEPSSDKEAAVPSLRRGLLFTSWDLIEYSVVPIPANPETVRSGLDHWVQSEYLKRSLQPWAATKQHGFVSLSREFYPMTDSSATSDAFLFEREGKALDTSGDLVGPPGQGPGVISLLPQGSSPPYPEVPTDRRRQENDAPQSLYFDVALFPDEKSCRSGPRCNRFP
jgi:phage head maturation protease